MQYEARLTVANGAFHTFEFEGDTAYLAVAHLIHVCNDPFMLKSNVAEWDREPEGNVVRMEYRRLYKYGGVGNWRVA